MAGKAQFNRQRRRREEREALRWATNRNPASAPLPRRERRRVTGDELTTAAAVAALVGGHQGWRR